LFNTPLTTLSGWNLMKLDSRNVFRMIAIAEAVSWAGLLVGMYFKWIAQSSEAGVKMFGPIHGTIVIGYLLTVMLVRSSFRWDARTTLLAVVASVPPFGTLVFEIWADRRGLLSPASSTPHSTSTTSSSTDGTTSSDEPAEATPVAP